MWVGKHWSNLIGKWTFSTLLSYLDWRRPKVSLVKWLTLRWFALHSKTDDYAGTGQERDKWLRERTGQVMIFSETGGNWNKSYVCCSWSWQESVRFGNSLAWPVWKCTELSECLQLKCSVSHKMMSLWFFGHNVDRFWPIFKILLAQEKEWNLKQQMYHNLHI